MIFLNNKLFAKVWKVTRPTDESGNPRKFINLQVSTSEKTQDGNYEYSNWFPKAIGHAMNSLKDVKEGDKIVITKAKLTNTQREMPDGNKKSFLDFIILEAEIQKDEQNANTSNETPAVIAEQTTPPQTQEDDCPW